MLSQEEVDKYAKVATPTEVSKKRATIFMCLLTATLASLTVWSINGTYTITNDYYPNQPELGTFVTIGTVDPVIQGILAFLTVGFFFISLASVISLQVDKLKTK